jgi:hypothetical protein
VFYPSTVPAASAASACTAVGGTVTQHCPTANLVGCCVTDAGTSCYYVGTAAELQSSCSTDNGTWTTTAP